MLEPAGLTTAEESAYLGLLRQGSATVDQLARRTGRPTTQISRAVAGLHRKGMVHRTPPPHGLVVPVPPDEAIEQLIQRQHAELDRVREAAHALAAQTRDRTAGRRTGELIEIVQGQASVQRAFDRVQRVAKATMRMLVAPPYAAAEQVNRVQMERGREITYRVVYTIDALADPATLAAAGEHVRNGEIARLAPSVPTKLAVADRTLALLPLVLTDAAQDAAVLVHPCALLDALVALFEGVWSTASPLGLSGAGEVTARGEISHEDRKLLSLLVAGMTDETAGARLGMSRRTVVRRVQHLMETAGAQSRLQLGWRARERGWLPEA
ncbi:Sugar-specific transcriptional regulator TrmB [Micromonospora coriariae]|uniref:Sugar-specific transcriptional regulator TrmB n=1 Tax=Micromonospora coriariae TaxID=285665 RepID=A0A1C4X6S7_9ACTN|nr:helix-turn-helix domain-containing protein [Micromonospora coriariae]SCF04154.1 Sugar-specific transcriptional regulator TrmB [Micromonospora coriariae]